MDTETTVKYFKTIRNFSIVEIFKELYPESEIEKEINPHDGTELYKTYSIFYNSNSKLPQLYFNENGLFGSDFFCFETGRRGYVPDILRYKFGEEGLNFPKKSLRYLLKKSGRNFNFQDLKYFVNEFVELSQEDFFDSDIFDNSLLANNSCELKDGSWVNTWTEKWEGWNKVI